MNGILIADSGSTKTDWVWVEAEGGRLSRFTTIGMNPFFQTKEEMTLTLRDVSERLALEMKPDTILSAVYFYGAGCTQEKIPQVSKVIEEMLSPLHLEISGDLLGAARALCERKEGIACILGTGSNSCYYDGQKMTANVSPLGFILGDEGSGAVLGKLWIGDILKNQQPPALRDEFLTRYSLTPADIIEKVYRQPFPNRFLANFSPFLSEHLSEPSVRKLVEQAFIAFFQRNVMQYEKSSTCPLHFTGSIAYYYREVLSEVAVSLGLCVGKIARSPLDGLIEYHLCLND